MKIKFITASFSLGEKLEITCPKKEKWTLELWLSNQLLLKIKYWQNTIGYKYYLKETEYLLFM